jgi:thymidylate kinase
VEGLDRLGKSTLIDGILNTCGFYQVIHFAKPQELECYKNTEAYLHSSKVPSNQAARFHYQYASFQNSMKLVKSKARIIFDRWHIGEAVYSPMYRNYSGDYVYELEVEYQLDREDIRLILLTQDFSKAQHFRDDGQSLGPVSNRVKEQEKFLWAVDRSVIKDKRIICVTGSDGSFKPKAEILREALQDG